MDDTYNALTVEIYSTGTTRISDAGGELPWASGLNFDTVYPAGLYTSGGLYIPRDVLRQWSIAGGQRVVFRNGLKIVYEGYIDQLESMIGDGAEQGVNIVLTGAWDYLLQRQRWVKIWADNRISENVWYTVNQAGRELFDTQRASEILYLYPKDGASAFGTATYNALRYSMPNGETVKRLYYLYDFAEPSGTWEYAFYRSTDGSSWTQMTGASGETYATGTTTVLTATGAGTVDVTLATPSRYVEMRLTSRAAQSYVLGTGVYAKISSLMVYSETGAISPAAIITDIAGQAVTLNSDVSQIGTNALEVAPFWSADDTLADIAINAALNGDSSNNRYAVGLLNSETATTPDGAPVMYFEQYPVLTDYDYAVRLSDENLLAPISIVEDFAAIANSIHIEYLDGNGYSMRLTPTDDASLEDATSVAAYGERHYLMVLGYATQSVAIDNGLRYLAAYKDPQYIVTSPVTFVGYIRAKTGERVPTSEIRAGMRLKFEDYVTDISGTGLTLLVTGTHYDDDTQTCTLTFGTPPAPWVQTMAAPTPAWRDPQDRQSSLTDPGQGGAGTRERLNWKRRMGLKPGTPEWDAAVSAQGNWAAKQAMLDDYKRRKKRRG